MILKKKNPTASQDNALQIFNKDGICCGDVSPVTVNDYTIAVNTGTLATLTAIRIAGVTYTLSKTYDLTSTTDHALLVTEIRGILEGLGYSSDGIRTVWATPTLTINVTNSEIVFTGLTSSGNAFTKGADKKVGIMA